LIPPDADSLIAEGQPNLILDTGQAIVYLENTGPEFTSYLFLRCTIEYHA